LPGDPHGRIHLRRLVVNDGKLVSRLRDGARITTGTLDKVRIYLSEHRTAAPDAQSQPAPIARPANGAAAAVPSGFRFFDKPPKIPAVRFDLQREDRGRQPDFARTRQSAAGAAGACGSSMPVSAMAPCCRG